MSDPLRPPDETSPPGTLTSLVEEVVQEAFGRGPQGAWSDGLRAGAVIGRYELVREVGRGGFGVVWEARDRDLGRAVALKALRASPEAVRERRLLAEAEVAARLSHPNIVTVLDVGRCEHGVYLVQEFLPGVSLRARLADGALPLREALRIGVEVARGLAHAHAHGVVHRDLTPGNVLLCDDGQVKILDLGMASALGRRKPEGGTPEYMAPEQLEAAPEDERTDVFALGVLLYRMLTGRSPFAAEGTSRSRSAARGLEVREVPRLGPLVEAMLARAPTDRPRDAREVLEILEEVAASIPRASRPGGARVRPPPRIRWVVAGLLAGALLAGLVSVALWRLQGGDRARLEGSGRGAERVLLAASAARTRCTWTDALRVDFDDPSRFSHRNGEYRGQGLRRIDGVPVWHMGSDWNELLVPLGEVRPDVFAVEVELLAEPAPGHVVAAGLELFTDPIGPMDSSSAGLVHGGGIGLVEEAGEPPSFGWAFPGGNGTSRMDYRGTLAAPFTGRWRTLRVEGSRSAGWLRATLDGQLLLVDVGPRDLDGRHVCLHGNGGNYRPANVQWKHLRVFQGAGDCR